MVGAATFIQLNEVVGNFHLEAVGCRRLKVHYRLGEASALDR